MSQKKAYLVFILPKIYSIVNLLYKKIIEVEDHKLLKAEDILTHWDKGSTSTPN